MTEYIYGPETALAIKAMFYTTVFCVGLAVSLACLYGWAHRSRRSAVKRSSRVLKINAGLKTDLGIAVSRVLALEQVVDELTGQKRAAEFEATKNGLESARNKAIRKRTEERLVAQNAQLAALHLVAKLPVLKEAA